MHASKATDGRNLATGEMWRTFIKQFSKSANMTEEHIEKSIIRYFQTKASNSTHGNYVSIGITEDQAQRIKTLGDDFAYMPKVRKWSLENMDKIFPSVKKNVLQDIYKEIVVSNRGIRNRYQPITNNSNTRRHRQRQISPIKSLSEKQEHILASIRQLDNRSIETILRKNLSIMEKRGSSSPAILANGQEIIESATLISQKTGLKGMGDGCESFVKNASSEVLEVKANIDLYRSHLIEKRAYNKNNGRSFASVSDVPKELRLTQAELDRATKDSFKHVLGYTDDEAAHAIKRLKSKPCRLY